MKYIILAFTMSLMATGYSLAEEPQDDGSDQTEQYANKDDSSLNLEDGNSSNWGYYGAGCRRTFSYCGGMGLYNPYYLYRAPPAFYSSDATAAPSVDEDNK